MGKERNEMTLQARVRIRGSDARQLAGAEELPDVSTEEAVKSAAGLVYLGMLERAKDKGRPHTYNGVAGWLWEGNRSWVIADLWPGLAREERPSGSITAGQRAEQKISKFLNDRGNYKLLQRPGRPAEGSGKTSTWWVRDEWNDTPLAGSRPSKRLELTRAERRVTPHEAGEDRRPGPVEVRHVQKPSAPEAHSKRYPLLRALQAHAGEVLHYTEIGREAGFDVSDHRTKGQVNSSLAAIVRDHPEMDVTFHGSGKYGYLVGQAAAEPPAPAPRPHYPAPAPAAKVRDVPTVIADDLHVVADAPLASTPSGQPQMLITRDDGSVWVAYQVAPPR